MLAGRFGNTSGRPYIEGRLVIPRLNISADLSFLVDTGADSTYLMPGEVARIGIDYGSLRPASVQTYGVGGVTTNFSERCLVAFADRNHVYVYERTLQIAPFDETLMRLPALLGRDIIDNWRLTYHPRRALLRASVGEADVVIPLTDGSEYRPGAAGFRHT